jgi:aspartate kinase
MRLTTLGRGGLRHDSMALAASSEPECEIYTDVDGVYTIDPRLYPRSKEA